MPIAPSVFNNDASHCFTSSSNFLKNLRTGFHSHRIICLCLILHGAFILEKPDDVHVFKTFIISVQQNLQFSLLIFREGSRLVAVCQFITEHQNCRSVM